MACAFIQDASVPEGTSLFATNSDLENSIGYTGGESSDVSNQFVLYLNLMQVDLLSILTPF